MLSLYIMTIAQDSSVLLCSIRTPSQLTACNVQRKNRAAGAAEGGCIHSSAVRLAAPLLPRRTFPSLMMM